jgi:hypothetical protein
VTRKESGEEVIEEEIPFLSASPTLDPSCLVAPNIPEALASHHHGNTQPVRKAYRCPFHFAANRFVGLQGTRFQLNEDMLA